MSSVDVTQAREAAKEPFGVFGAPDARKCVEGPARHPVRGVASIFRRGFACLGPPRSPSRWTACARISGRRDERLGSMRFRNGAANARTSCFWRPLMDVAYGISISKNEL